MADLTALGSMVANWASPIDTDEAEVPDIWGVGRPSTYWVVTSRDPLTLVDVTEEIRPCRWDKSLGRWVDTEEADD